MTQQEILEKNKLIAEFMGLFYDRGDWRDDEGIIYSLYDLYKGVIPYHKSWDWLMPVVEKISLCTNLKETIYKGVIEFIKWYNKNETLQ